jgi:hypothetical protein
MSAALSVNYTVDPLRAFDVGLLMAAMQRLPTSLGLARMGTIGQKPTLISIVHLNSPVRVFGSTNPQGHLANRDEASIV